MNAVAPAGIGHIHARIQAIEARIGVRSPMAPATTRTAGAANDFAAALASVRGQGGLSPAARSHAGGAAPTPQAIASMAREYLDIPYLWGGTDPGRGMDCSGFVQHLFRRVGVELPRVSADQARAGQRVPSMAEARPGDLLSWDTGPRNRGADHIAVYLGGGQMIEASASAGRIRVVAVRAPDAITRVLPEAATGQPGDAPGAATFVAAMGVHGGPGATRLTVGTPFADLFAQAGARHGVDPLLLALVAEHESSFNPSALSPAGAQGLMQLMPATAAELGVRNPFDPAQAIDGAARLLAGHLARYGGRVDLALAAYNAGPGAVARHGGIPPFAETQRYVARIMARYGGAT